MAVFTETRHTGGFMLSEANGTRSRDTVTIVSGQNLKAGMVLGKITASGKYKEFNTGSADGSQTAVAVLYADCNASAADTPAVVISRDAEVTAGELLWFSGATNGNITTGKTGLAAVGIIAR